MSGVKTCIFCGKEYTGRNKYTCSHTCWALHRANIKKCIICGKKFQSPPSASKVTCGKKCSHKYSQQLAAKGLNAQALKKAQIIAKNDPRLQPDENHINAKTWRIQSPDGKIYECRNLMNFFREHTYLIDSTAYQAWDGITKIKYSMQGKMKQPVSGKVGI